MGNFLGCVGGKPAADSLEDATEVASMAFYRVCLRIYRMPVLGRYGGYHSALVVSGERCHSSWSFDQAGMSEAPADSQTPLTLLRTIKMGSVASWQEVEEALAAMREAWQDAPYDMVTRNCNHFTSQLSWRLVGLRPPEWVNAPAMRLHNAQKTRDARGLACARARTAAEAAGADWCLDDYTSAWGRAWGRQLGHFTQDKASAAAAAPRRDLVAWQAEWEEAAYAAAAEEATEETGAA